MKGYRPYLAGALALAVLVALYVALGPSKGTSGGPGPNESQPNESLGAPPEGTPAVTNVVLADGARAPSRTVLTPAQRAELAKKIHGALWAESGKKPSQDEIGKAPPNAPSLSPAYIQQRIREDLKPMAEKCYEDLLSKHPDAGGTANMEFTIVADEKLGGVVEDTKLGDGSSLVDPAFSTCLLESLSTVSFPAPAKGGKTTVHYPLTFSPGDDDDDGGAPPAASAAPKK